MVIKVIGEYLEIGKASIEIGPGLNSKLEQVLGDNGGKRFGMHSGFGLDTKAISGKLMAGIIQAILAWHTKESTYAAAVRVASEDAGPMKNWCKIIQLAEYDVLVRKDYHEEKEAPALSFHIYHIEQGLDMNIKIVCGSEAKMNDSFDNISPEGAEVFAKQMTSFLK